MCPNDKSLPLRPELPEERPRPASQPSPPLFFPFHEPRNAFGKHQCSSEVTCLLSEHENPPRPCKTRDQSRRGMPSTKGSLTSPRLASNRPWRHSLDHDFLP